MSVKDHTYGGTVIICNTAKQQSEISSSIARTNNAMREENMLHLARSPGRKIHFQGKLFANINDISFEIADMYNFRRVEFDTPVIKSAGVVSV